MKRIFIAITCLITIVYAFSCGKTGTNDVSCTGPKAALDSTQLLAYAAKYSITPTIDTSYMYYQIIAPGSGASPTIASTVYVRYAARFMDGTYLDSSGTALGFLMSNLIKGWQYGLPKIKVGGEIKLLVPSVLAYACAGTSKIPPNSPLYFNIYLDSLK